MICRYFYDFEFLEDGRTIDPISVGVACDDGREFYAVFEEIAEKPGTSGTLYERIRRHSWLMANVIPHLPLTNGWGGKGYKPVDELSMNVGGGYTLDTDSLEVLPRHVIAKQLKAFLLAPFDSAGPEVQLELWAYYGAYDHVALAQLLGGPMAHLPTGIPFWTHDLMQELERRNVTADDLFTRNPDEEHNAIADARWNLRVWRELAELDAMAAAA